MTLPTARKDIVFLVADANMQFAIDGVLERPEAIPARPVTATIHVHPERDPGCLVRGHDFLRPFVNQYGHAVIMLDREGCGREQQPRESLEAQIDERLAGSGWGDRAAAIVIDPELEMWVWSDSPHVESVLGWKGKEPDLRSWLASEGYLSPGLAKPERPKKCGGRSTTTRAQAEIVRSLWTTGPASEL